MRKAKAYLSSVFQSMQASLFTVTCYPAVRQLSMLAASLGIELQHVVNHMNDSISSRQIEVTNAHAININATAPGVPQSDDSAAHRIHSEVITENRPVAVHAVDTACVKCSPHHVMFHNFGQLLRIGQECFHCPRGAELQFSKGPVCWSKQSKGGRRILKGCPQ